MDKPRDGTESSAVPDRDPSAPPPLPATSEAVAPPGRPTWDRVHCRDLVIGVAVLWALEVLLGGTLVVGTGGAGHTMADHPLALLVVTLADGCLTGAVAWFFVCRKYRRSFAEGFLLTPPTRRLVLTCLALGVGYGIIAAALAAQFSTGRSMLEQMTGTTLGMACFSLMALALPVAEELYYRGFAFPVLQRRFGDAAAATMVILWFAAAHVPQLAKDWIGVPIVAVAGAIWTLQRLKTDSLTGPLITHLVYNLTLVLIALAGKLV